MQFSRLVSIVQLVKLGPRSTVQTCLAPALLNTYSAIDCLLVIASRASDIPAFVPKAQIRRNKKMDAIQRRNRPCFLHQYNSAGKIQNDI